MKGKRVLPALGAVIASAALAWSWPRFFPTLRSIDPQAAAAGDRVVIRGSGFGPMSKSSQVLVDGSALTDKSIISWTGKEIAFFMPATLDSGLVAVRTVLGTSRAEGVVAAAKVPRAPERAESATAGPVITEISPPTAEPGMLVKIDGINFGAGGQGASVRFARSATGNSGSLPGEIEHWDDKSIAAYVPDGSGSGAIIVTTPSSRSLPVYLMVAPKKGTRELGNPVTYSVSQRVSVSGIRTASRGSGQGSNEFCVWLPDIPDTAAQERLQELGSGEAPFIASMGGASMYRWTDLADKSSLEFSRSRLVRVYETEISIAASASFPSSEPRPAHLEALIRPDPFVPSDRKEIADRAVRIVGQRKDQRLKAAAIWEWLVRNMKWTRSGKGGDVIAAIRAGSADSRTYALVAVSLLRAAGVPSQAVAGALIGADGAQVPHFWAEYHLSGVGWVPFDAVLGSGAHPGGFGAGYDEVSRYHGSLDNRHVAVSRGFLALSPLLSEGAKRTARAQWSMQSLFEEARGLDSWASEWPEPEIRRVY